MCMVDPIWQTLDLSQYYWRVLEGQLQVCCKCTDFWIDTLLAKNSQQQGLYFVELSSKSTWLLVGSRLFYIQHLPCSVSFGCMLGGNAEVSIKNILYHFIEGQTHHFGIPRSVKIVYSSRWTEMGCSTFKFKHYYLQACTITSRKKEIVDIVPQTTNRES